MSPDELAVRLALLEREQGTTAAQLAEINSAIRKLEARVWLLATAGAASGAIAGPFLQALLSR